MPIVSDASIDLAVKNIAVHGDTDVFPLPIENAWFFDQPTVVAGLLKQIDASFDAALTRYPIQFQKNLASVGYWGFRAATQIDPIWNAYLLALVLELAPDIEQARLPVDKERVFSYRFSPKPDGTIFDPDIGWFAFHKAALEKSEVFTSVLSTDISDFYPRLYHHRLENAMGLATKNHTAANRIMKILMKLSTNASYGLPVGGNAARLLAELSLNRIDRLMLADGIEFVRFVDDYFIFGNSREEVHRALVGFSEALLRNEGLSLSRVKTRYMTRAEFRRNSPANNPDDAESEEEVSGRRFLRLRLTYDPYSATAGQDYDTLAVEVERFDILSMLTREFGKSRVDETLTRQLLKAIRFLAPSVREQAILSLTSNLAILAPVFPTVALTLRRVLPDISDATRAAVFEAIGELLQQESYVTLVPTNRLYAIRILANDNRDETETLLVQLYNHPKSDMMIKRDIILAMTKRRCAYWLSDLLKRFGTLTPWERRALLTSSYCLGDEGSHWRDSIKAELSDVDREFLKWVGGKNSGRSWDLPL